MTKSLDDNDPFEFNVPAHKPADPDEHKKVAEEHWDQVEGRPKGIERNRQTGVFRNVQTS